MGLVGLLPRTLFNLIFDSVDDRDKAMCAVMGEILDTWDKRRCFSKKLLQDARSKIVIPKGANPERDEGRGWYALLAGNLNKKPAQAPRVEQQSTKTAVESSAGVVPTTDTSSKPKSDRKDA